MAENIHRNTTNGSLELSAEDVRHNKIMPAPVSHLRKQSESSSGMDEDVRQQLHRIETKLDAVLAFMKASPK